MWKELKDFLPGLPGNEPSSQAMGASLTSLGMTTLARARRPDLLSYSEWLRRWAEGRVEMAFKAEPAATATVIALYGLAVSEVWNCPRCLCNYITKPDARWSPAIPGMTCIKAQSI